MSPCGFVSPVQTRTFTPSDPSVLGIRNVNFSRRSLNPVVISANLPPFGFPDQVFILILEDESPHNRIGLLYTLPPRGKSYQNLQGIDSEMVLAEHVIGHSTILLL